MCTYSLDETLKISRNLGLRISNGDSILLFGEIGVGKTTFVRLLINSLEKKNNLLKSYVLSPTFNIVYEYNIKKIKIMHYDLYRLKNFKDILELGLFEDLEKSVKLVEWPELISEKPTNRIEIYFEYCKKPQKRKIYFKKFGRCDDYELSKH